MNIYIGKNISLILGAVSYDASSDIGTSNYDIYFLPN
jgi:hypothetical protein